jgi:hypothetical protein
MGRCGFIMRIDGIKDLFATMNHAGTDDPTIYRTRAPSDDELAALSHLLGGMTIMFGSDRTRDEPDSRFWVVFDIG